MCSVQAHSKQSAELDQVSMCSVRAHSKQLTEFGHCSSYQHHLQVYCQCHLQVYYQSHLQVYYQSHLQVYCSSLLPTSPISNELNNSVNFSDEVHTETKTCNELIFSDRVFICNLPPPQT